MDIGQLFAAFFVGVTTGAVFSLFDLPIPAPRALAGVLGIAGVYIGYKLVGLVTQHWDVIIRFLTG